MTEVPHDPFLRHALELLEALYVACGNDDAEELFAGQCVLTAMHESGESRADLLAYIARCAKRMALDK